MSETKSYFYHALNVNKDICLGCTHCIKSCPTEAIRIKNGKAEITDNKCIDCGECLKSCSVNAIHIKQDDFDSLNNYKYRIALVPAIFIGQFDEKYKVSQIYSCLKDLGFTHIYEVEHGVGFLIDMVKKYMSSNTEQKFFISSFCPAVIRLIQVRFSSLVKNIIHLKAPLDISSYIVFQRLIDAGIKKEEIGIFYITPCAAKIAAVKSPVEKHPSPIHGVINMDFLYNKVRLMLNNSKSITEPINHNLVGRDVLWSLTGGEAKNFQGRCFAIDGVKNVIDFLEKIENEEIEPTGLIEMRVCNQSCAGGVLNSNNRFAAMERLRKRAIYLDKSNSKNITTSLSPEFYNKIESMMEIEAIKPRSILKLDDNIQKALEMMEKIKKTERLLPDVDCGICGAPSCAAFAEDIGRNIAQIEDCVFFEKENYEEFSKKIKEIWGNREILKK
ncbi:MAG: 4Fe-4S dicluster domain-containing protein [Bacteroidales bacterium]|jgi:iron only hydrogenase large subunit-like protein|nr:4Fe-4S dicluster domain-containing protein [Bacteroidales bacterium]